MPSESSAPLHDLLPSWPETRAAWKELEAGEFDWAHQAMRHRPDRVTEACRTNRSFAIAHNPEHLCPAAPPKAGKKPGRKKNTAPGLIWDKHAMHPPEFQQPDSTPSRLPAGFESDSAPMPVGPDLTSQALQLRSSCHYALHPVESALQYLRAEAEIPGEKGHGGCGFEEAEAHYRAGAQGLRLSEIPQLPQHLRELSRLGPVDRAGRKSLRKWAEECGHVFDEVAFSRNWHAQGERGGAEHQVYHDQEVGRWFKRLYFGVNHSTLGDYLARMRLHGVIFPETAYRLQGFTINAKSKELAPVVSQPHVEVDTRAKPSASSKTTTSANSTNTAPSASCSTPGTGWFTLHKPCSATSC
jgi:hypothetical protein